MASRSIAMAARKPIEVASSMGSSRSNPTVTAEPINSPRKPR